MKPRSACELCNGEAALHCDSDSAYLCWACDARVHGANFLVARHARRLLCLQCGAVDAHRRPVFGPGYLPVRFLCRPCYGTKQGDGYYGGGGGFSDSDSESSSCCSSSLRSFTPSSCVSSAGSGVVAESGAAIASAVAVAVAADGDGPIKAACSASSATTESSVYTNPSRTRRRGRRARTGPRRDVDAKSESVLLNWCRRIGLEDASAPGAASHALGVGARRKTTAPFRVVAAAAVWFAAKQCCAEANRRRVALLRRLEACSGVAAKLIQVAEARLSRAVRGRHLGNEGEGEGWAECS